MSETCYLSDPGYCHRYGRFEVWTEARSQRIGLVCGRHLVGLLDGELGIHDVLVTANVRPSATAPARGEGE